MCAPSLLAYSILTDGCQDGVQQEMKNSLRFCLDFTAGTIVHEGLSFKSLHSGVVKVKWLFLHPVATHFHMLTEFSCGK